MKTLTQLKEELKGHVTGRLEDLKKRNPHNGSLTVTKLEEIIKLIDTKITDTSQSYSEYLAKIKKIVKSLDYLNKPNDPLRTYEIFLDHIKEIEALIKNKKEEEAREANQRLAKAQSNVQGEQEFEEQQKELVEEKIKLGAEGQDFREEEQKTREEKQCEEIQEEPQLEEDPIEDEELKVQQLEENQSEIKEVPQTEIIEDHKFEEEQRKLEEQRLEEQRLEEQRLEEQRLEEEKIKLKEQMLKEQQRLKQEKDLKLAEQKRQAEKRAGSTTALYVSLYKLHYAAEVFTNPKSKMKARIEKKPKTQPISKKEDFDTHAQQNPNSRTHKLLEKVRNIQEKETDSRVKQITGDDTNEDLVNQFILAYRVAYQAKFFTNPFSKMKRMLNNKSKPITYADIERHAADDKDSRTAQVWNAIKNKRY